MLLDPSIAHIATRSAVDLEALQATSGSSDEEVVSALEVLASRGIFSEVAEEAGAAPRYDFTHEKLRGLVYVETSLARRRLLHGRAARSLAERARLSRDQAAQAGTIGRHFRLAGLGADAAIYFALAGDHARGLYANAEALAHYQVALALGHPETRRLREAVGDMHMLLGGWNPCTVASTAALRQSSGTFSSTAAPSRQDLNDSDRSASVMGLVVSLWR